MNNDPSPEQSPQSINDPQPVTAAEQPAAEPYKPPIVPPKRNKKPWIIAILIVVLVALVGGGAYAYLETNNTKVADTAPPAASISPTPQPPAALTAYGLLYVDEKQSVSTGPDGCLVSDVTLYQKPIDGGDATTIHPVKDHQQLIRVATNDKGYVLLTTAASCSSKEGAGLWLSTNSGESFEQIYKGKGSAKPSMGDQVTSAIFSNDKKSVIFAAAADPVSKGIVREVNIETKKTTELFSVDEPGVHLQGYDTQKRLVYYYAGCYNCAGFMFAKPIAYDLAKKSNTTLFDDSAYGSFTSVMDASATKILRTKFTTGDWNAATQPYIVEEFNTTTKKAAALATFDQASGQGDTDAKYAFDGKIYYSSGSKLITVADGKPTTALTATKPIMDIYHVGDDSIIVSIGDQSGGSTISYDVKAKSTATLIDYKYPRAVFGVTYK